MLCNFDLHMHTYYSKDGACSPEAMIEAARARGLQGIAITDHDTCEAVEYLREIGKIREDGMPVDGFLIVPGVEVSTAEGHLLCLGVTLPWMKGRPALEVCEEVHRRGGVVIPAHPYDTWRAGIREHVLETLPIDALEIFNAAVTRKRYNRQASEYARRRGVGLIAGSDSHHASAIGTAYTRFELPELNVANLLTAIRTSGDVVQNYLSFREGVKKHLGNWFRIFNPGPKPRISSKKLE
ncbi:MAG: PHP domain-containing protein [Chthoniobacterales bacterium]